MNEALLLLQLAVEYPLTASEAAMYEDDDDSERYPSER